MNKKFINGFLLATLVAGSGGILSSCKDYDDDIDQLRQEVAVNKSAIDDINSKIANGAILEGVTKSDNGITVTVSKNGQKQTYEITNGKDGTNGTNGTDGKDADVWTIVKNAEGKYVWAVNDKETDFPAQGPQGPQGIQGIQGEPGTGTAGGVGPEGPAGTPGLYWAPNADGSKLVKWEWNAEEKKYVETADTKDIAVKLPDGSMGNLTAVLDNNYLYINGVDGDKSVVIARSGQLVGLGFIPALYVDGVEAARTAFAAGNYINYDNSTKGTGKVNITATETADFTIPSNWTFKALTSGYDLSEKSTVEFKLNPDNAVIANLNFNFLPIENVEFKNISRAGTPSLKVVGTPERDKNDASVLVVNYNVVNPSSIGYGSSSKKTLPVTAFTATLPKTAEGAQATTITSDYYSLMMEKATFKAISFAGTPDNNHLATTGVQAVIGKNGNVTFKNVDVKFTGKYDLKSALRVCITKSDLDDKNANPADVQYDFDKVKDLWGLEPKFEMMSYYVGASNTDDSQYGDIDPVTGLFTPQYVDASGANKYPCSGETPEQTTLSRAAIGKHPVVAVTLRDANGNIVLGGFVKFNIVEEDPAMFNTPIELTVSDKLAYTCSNNAVVSSTWAETSYKVFSKLGLSEQNFKDQYEWDMDNVYVEAAGSTEKDPKFEAVKKTTDAQTGKTVYEFGSLLYNKDTQSGLTNGFLTWTYDVDAAAAIIAKNPTDRQITLYAKFKKRDNENANLYLGMTIRFMESPKVSFGDLDPYMLVNNEAQHVAMQVLGVEEGTKDVEVFQSLLKKYYKGNVIKPTVSPAAYASQTVNQVYQFGPLSGQMSGKVGNLTLNLQLKEKKNSGVANTALLQGNDTIATIDPVSGEIVYANTPSSKVILNGANTAYINVMINPTYGTCNLPFASVENNTNIVKVDVVRPVFVENIKDELGNVKTYPIYPNGVLPFEALLGSFFTMHDSYNGSLFALKDGKYVDLEGRFAYYEIQDITIDFSKTSASGVKFYVTRNGSKATPVAGTTDKYKFSYTQNKGFSVEILNQVEIVCEYTHEQLQQPQPSSFELTVNSYWGEQTITVPMTINPKGSIQN